MKTTTSKLALLFLTGTTLFAADSGEPTPSVRPAPVVEIEEELYTFAPADNGAGPMWCSGSTCLVRIGEAVFASGLETLPGAKPLNNCRWLLFARGQDGWKLQQADPAGRTREPCPLAGFPDGRLFLSVNPTLATDPQAYAGRARPEILQFAAGNTKTPAATLVPGWDGDPKFSEHSYRSFAADGSAGELLLFQNIDYTHAEWAFRDKTGGWPAHGQLAWPRGENYDKPQPIRVCYPDVALKNRAVHFCGVSDIVEPNEAWRKFKKELTGREWDYDFRRLFYTWTPDITRVRFGDWVEIASRDKTCGWISPGDLWVAPDGAAHLLWVERAIDERLRDKFFPGAKQSHTLNYARVREGKVVWRRTLLEAREGGAQEVPSAGRFHVTPEGRLFVVAYISGADANGNSLSENRLWEMRTDGQTEPPVRLAFQKPFTSFFTATVRAGSAPSDLLEFLGHQAGKPQIISYGRVRLR
jgi:hypothetical protein